MKKVFIYILIVIAAVVAIFIAINYSHPSNQSHDNVKWQTDLNTALQEAKNTNKAVFIDFYSDSCSWCKKLDTDTFSDPSVYEKINQNYIPVKINTFLNPDLSSKYKIYGIPTLVILNSNGEEIKRQEGYVPAIQLLFWLNT